MVVSLSFLTFACASTGSETGVVNAKSKASVYRQTGNHAKLAELYKAQLAEQDSPSLREQLAETYLQLNDADNALFYIAPVIASDHPSCQAFYIQAQALVEQGELAKAQNSAQTALNMCAGFAESENLLGIIYATQYDYPKARESFDAARRHFYASDKVNNNLAVVDIAEGKYRSAIHRLLPLYTNNQADEQVIANLVLSMAKEGQYQFVYQVLEANHTDGEIEQIYQVLRRYQPLSQPVPVQFKGAEHG